MNSKQLWATAATILALSVFDPRSSEVWAQSDLAACHAGWEWNQNSLGQDPCTISSRLEAACRVIGSYSIASVNSTEYYPPPQRNITGDLTCECDTVMYSLYMACTTCQGGLIYSWAGWIPQCDSVYVMQYPHNIPQGTAIPQWAFYNVTSLPDQTYNDTVAMAIGRNPEALPNTISTIGPSSSSTTSFTTISTGIHPPSVTSSSSASDPFNTTDSSGGKTNTAAIVGGVVGGVVPLIILSVVAFLFLRRRNQGGGSRPLPSLPPPTKEVPEYFKVQPASPVLSPTNANLPYTPYYNPNDPTTFPPQTSDRRSSLSFVSPHPSSGSQGQGHGQGRYPGVPEIY